MRRRPKKESLTSNLPGGTQARAASIARDGLNPEHPYGARPGCGWGAACQDRFPDVLGVNEHIPPDVSGWSVVEIPVAREPTCREIDRVEEEMVTETQAIERAAVSRRTGRNGRSRWMGPSDHGG
jgi:hypothetical protein